jgi:hypothetical protein
MRNLVNTAIVSYEVIKTGNVGTGGSTGAILDRSLLGLRDLIGRSLVEVRLSAGMQNKEAVPLGDFVETLKAAATQDATARGRILIGSPVDAGYQSVRRDPVTAGARVTFPLRVS